MSERTLILGGEVIDQSGRRRADVAIADGRIVAVGAGLSPAESDHVLDATGCVVSPGFVDLHTHLREPGKEEAETIETGSRAAALGGFTAVVAMPNTDPAQDSVAVVEFVRQQGVRAGLCEVVPSGCITIGRAGERLAPFGELAAAGVHTNPLASLQLQPGPLHRLRIQPAELHPDQQAAGEIEPFAGIAAGHRQGAAR